MKTVSLSGSARQNVGKQDANQLRDKGRIPCVLYGGPEQIHFHVDSRDIDKLFFTPDVYAVELDVENKKVKAIIQEVQQHPVTDNPTHVDFLEVINGKPVKVALPVRTTGNAIGVMNGGRLMTPYRRLMVTGLIDDIPEAIELDISSLRIGGGIRIGDIQIPGIEFLNSHEAYVVNIKTAREAIVEEEPELEEGEEGAEGEEGTEAKEGETSEKKEESEGGDDKPAEGGEE